MSTKARAVHFHSSVRRVQIDLVMVTSGGYYAFAVERRPNVGGALFAALMAILLVIGGCLSLSDRRLRVGAPRRAKQPATDAVPAE